MKSFELIGREADKASQDVQNLTAFLRQLGSEQAAAAMLTVTIERAAWGNGTMALQGELQAVVRARAGELIAEALGHMQEKAANRVAELQAAVAGMGAPAPAPVPQPPALDPQSAGAIVEAAAPDHPDRAPGAPMVPDPEMTRLLGIRDKLSPQARELLAYLRKNGKASLARTQERTDLHKLQLIQEFGTGPKAQWFLTGLGDRVALAGA